MATLIPPYDELPMPIVAPPPGTDFKTDPFTGDPPNYIPPDSGGGEPFDPWNFPDITQPFPYQDIPRHDWMAEAERLRQNEYIQGIMGQLERGLGPIRSTLAELMNMSPEALQERYQATIETPALRYYQEQTLPSLRRGFVGPGTFWSSMRAGAEQRSGERLNEALMGQRMKMVEEARGKALTASQLGMQLEQQAFGGGMYPWETALKAAPFGVQQRGQDLQMQLADLQRRATLEQMRQRERELWGYGESYPGVGSTPPQESYWGHLSGTGTVSPSGTPIGYDPLKPQQTEPTNILGAAL